MTEQEIYDMIIETQDLLDKVLRKRNTTIINNVTSRYNKYYNSNEQFNQSVTKNAVIENKVKNTVLQALILKKINELELPGDYQMIYSGIPSNLLDQEYYITTLKKQYELVNKSFRLIMEIELLSEKEYNVDFDKFKVSEYSNIKQLENNLFMEFIVQRIISREYISFIINNYINTLSLEQKQQLYLESISLCYERNSFDFFNDLNLLLKLYSKTGIDLKSLSFDRGLFHQLLIDCYLNHLDNTKSLSEIYNDINTIHNSPTIKSLIKK